MKAKGIDTCVVLRLLTGEPPAQAQAAKSFVDQCYIDGVEVCVSDLMLAEAYHALLYHYGVDKKQALCVLKDFLASPKIAPTGHALAVLAIYEGKGAGLVDRLIRRDLLDHAYEVKTFDRNFAKLDNVTLLK